MKTLRQLASTVLVALFLAAGAVASVYTQGSDLTATNRVNAGLAFVADGNSNNLWIGAYIPGFGYNTPAIYADVPSEASTAPGTNVLTLDTSKGFGAALGDEHTTLVAIENFGTHLSGFDIYGQLASPSGVNPNNFMLVEVNAPSLASDGTIAFVHVPTTNGWISIASNNYVDITATGTNGGGTSFDVTVTDSLSNVCSAQVPCNSGSVGPILAAMTGTCVMGTNQDFTVALANTAHCAVAPTARSLSLYYGFTLAP